MASLTGARSTHPWLLTQRAYVHAHRGNVEQARRDCADAMAVGDYGNLLPLQWRAASLGLLELSLGNPQAAWDACRAMIEPLEAYGLAEPTPSFFLPTALEALIELGRLDRAEALIDVLERRGRELDRTWALATGGRCRGLLLAARGNLTAAEETLECALREHQRLEMPFERARTLLCLGRVMRRGKRRKLARETLAEALETFQSLGASLWAERHAPSSIVRTSARRHNSSPRARSRRRDWPRRA